MASSSQIGIADNNADQATVNLLNFIIQASSTGLPIKNTDLIALFDNKQSFAASLPTAQAILSKTYGIKLKELPSKTSGGKKYICMATARIASMYELTKKQQTQRTLLFVVLSFIFMRGGCVEESQLKSFLLSIDIDWDEDHEYFGPNIKKQIEDTFVKQLHLKKEKIESTTLDEKNVYYKWGARAEIEFSKREVLDTVAKLLNYPPSYFVEQYQLVKDIAENNDDDDDEDSDDNTQNGSQESDMEIL